MMTDPAIITRTLFSLVSLAQDRDPRFNQRVEELNIETAKELLCASLGYMAALLTIFADMKGIDPDELHMDLMSGIVSLFGKGAGQEGCGA